MVSLNNTDTMTTELDHHHPGKYSISAKISIFGQISEQNWPKYGQNLAMKDSKLDFMV